MSQMSCASAAVGLYKKISIEISEHFIIRRIWYLYFICKYTRLEKSIEYRTLLNVAAKEVRNIPWVELHYDSPNMDEPLCAIGLTHPCRTRSKLSSVFSSKLSSNLPYASNRATPPPYPAKGLGKEWGSPKYGGDPTLTQLQRDKCMYMDV